MRTGNFTELLSAGRNGNCDEYAGLCRLPESIHAYEYLHQSDRLAAICIRAWVRL